MISEKIQLWNAKEKMLKIRKKGKKWKKSFLLLSLLFPLSLVQSDAMHTVPLILLITHSTK